MKRSSGSSIICRSVESRRENRNPVDPVRVSGATPSAQAYLLSLLPGPLVVICANDDLAAELASDLEVFRGAPVLLFPSWEQSPFSSIALSIRTRIERTAILSALAHGASAPIVVTSLPALSQNTMPKEFFLTHSLRLAVGETLESREQLILTLLENGYLRVDPVEDPGTFAVRGDIIDLFPIGSDQPLRIELFDNEIERIRAFDPGTQRAQDPLEEVRVPPAREVLLNRETTPAIRERLKTRADDAGVSRTVRDPILASVQSGNYPDHCDAWAAFAYKNPATLLDYLPDATRIAWVDELSSEQGWDDFIAEQEKLSQEMEQNGIILPPAKSVFLWGDGLEKRVREKTDLYLDRLELATAAELPSADTPTPQDEETQISARHSTGVRDNKDLLQGTKRESAFTELEKKFKLWIKQGFKSLVYASTPSQLERIRYILDEHGIVALTDGEPEPGRVYLRTGTLTEGFRWPAEGLVVLNESEILGSPRARKRQRTTVESGSAAKDWSGLQALSDLSVGDAVVHIDHGIGRYQGLVRLSLSGAPSDFLLLEYANKDRLYLPVYRLNVIQKYVGSGEGVQLDLLGSQHFAKAKEKVREEVKKLAIDLVQLYAERKIRPGFAFSQRDALFREFEAKFPFDETPDQLKAIDQVLGDLESGRVMDRLVCGDVGYGKTEVAIRAAFRAVSDGKQVAVLVPTTVLAFQHEQSFRARMKDYPIIVESVSRFKTAKEQKTVLENLKNGKVDVVIGTHRLLSKDVSFHDLALIIVDEEHRFGVEHKEKLKTLKTNTHVLTLTATPIPRTLHMALSGIRDISLINTPPVDRLPIRTYVSKFDEELIQRAVRFELSRGGQVFFLHNRVQTIYEIAKKIGELCPEASIGVGHGQMAEGELENAMLAFYQKKTNVLVSTTIIESGLDIPNANTIIIDRADTLGLAQLYQIRGRVGRGQQRAYAYLLIPPETAITGDAKRRLEVIQRFVELGSGFSVASHDLEIRGGGDLLGARQSGHIAAVGFDLYMELLDEAIRELRKKPMAEEAPSSSREPEIKTPFPAFLPEEYVPDIHQRLSLYRRFSASNEEAEVTSLEEELRDRFGPLPAEAQNLLWMIRIKQILKKTGIDTLTVGPEKVSMLIHPQSRIDPARAIGMAAGEPSKYQLTPDSKLVAKIPTGSLRDLFFALEKLLKSLVAAV